MYTNAIFTNLTTNLLIADNIKFNTRKWQAWSLKESLHEICLSVRPHLVTRTNK